MGEADELRRNHPKSRLLGRFAGKSVEMTVSSAEEARKGGRKPLFVDADFIALPGINGAGPASAV
ncbi:MAG: hypothetical protein ABII76_26040 [Pseudomonadota bacterium]